MTKTNYLEENKEKFLQLSKIKQVILNDEEIISISINHAYHDMCRTLRGISGCGDKESYKLSAIDFLKNEMMGFLNGEIIDFKIWHENTTINLINAFNFRPFTIGQSQKWINMTFKYLYCLKTLSDKKSESLFFDCHIPIDSIVIAHAKEKYGIIFDEKWSKISDYHTYINFQNQLREIAETEKITPLQMDFELWNDGRR